MTYDLTPIVQALITLCAAVITAFVIPYIKRKLGEQDTESLLQWVNIAVQAAEQLYTAVEGEKKKEYVISFLEERGYHLDEAGVDEAIEAAVLRLHTSLYGAEKTIPESVKVIGFEGGDSVDES